MKIRMFILSAMHLSCLNLAHDFIIDVAHKAGMGSCNRIGIIKK